jgi:voltage-gated potassium channel
LVVIESDSSKIPQAELDGHLVLEGDATEEDILRTAGIERAKSMVTTLPSDAANVFITLTARELNNTVQIIARAENPNTEKKLRRAGATKVVMPAANSAKHMVRMITRPSTAHLIDLMGERSFLDLEMDELVISPASKLVGVTVGKSEVNYKHKLLVVAVKQSDDTMVFNPGGSYEFRSHDVAIVMGKRRDIEGFCNLHKLQA